MINLSPRRIALDEVKQVNLSRLKGSSYEFATHPLLRFRYPDH